jgi:hypothetical protein
MSDDVFTTADFYGSDGGEDETFDEVFDEGTDDAAPETSQDVGQGEVTEQPEDSTYFDLSQYAGQKVRVKVDGEEIAVPVEELLGGYSRTSDYTRKTQELAAQRQEVAFWQQVDAAMRVNPQKTLEYLSQQFGVQQATAATEATDDDWGEYTDPAIAKQLAAFQQQVAPALEFVQQQQAERVLTGVIDGLSKKYGDDFNATEVVTEALNRGIHDPSMLEAVYRDMDYERVRARLAATQHVSADQAATDAKRTAAAQQAAALVGNGSSAPRGRATAAQVAEPKTIAEAWALAKAEMGLA